MLEVADFDVVGTRRALERHRRTGDAKCSVAVSYPTLSKGTFDGEKYQENSLVPPRAS
jgi:hypothetical protein